MIKTEKYNNLLEMVLGKLAAIDSLVTKEQQGTVGLYKDDVQFGMIKADALHLIDRLGVFKQVPLELLDDNDQFLRLATEAYWVASGKK